jgi:hypothetical protein
MRAIYDNPRKQPEADCKENFVDERRMIRVSTVDKRRMWWSQEGESNRRRSMSVKPTELPSDVMYFVR